MLERFHEGQRNVVILHYNKDLGFGDRQVIDVWWGGLKRNGGLMLTLAYLLQTSIRWRGARIRVKMVRPTEEAAGAARPNLEAVARGLRSGAEVEVLVNDTGRPFVEIMKESSADADMIFLGMREPGEDYVEYYERLRHAAEAMPTTAFVLASEDLPFGEIVLKSQESERG
jgi:hypothetical protein